MMNGYAGFDPLLLNPVQMLGFIFRPGVLSRDDRLAVELG